MTESLADRTSRQLAYFLPAAILSAWGVFMLHAITSGQINRLLSPFFRDYVLVAAILLIVLSALYLALFQPQPFQPTFVSWSSRLRLVARGAALLLPLFLAIFLSPEALSSTTLSNRSASDTTGALAMPTLGAASAENAKEALSADPNQPVPVDVTDLITISRSPAQIAAFDGRKVRVIGFIIGGQRSPRLMRGMMWCCAADVQPVSVRLSGNLPAGQKETQWMEVTGLAHFPSTMGRIVPEVEVASSRPTVEPDEPYLAP